jgi:hypothetical protein
VENPEREKGKHVKQKITAEKSYTWEDSRRAKKGLEAKN